nr:radical SAM protein [Desulfobacterales bacterium]
MTDRPFQNRDEIESQDLQELLSQARRISWDIHGKKLHCYIPGQMVYMGTRGRYPVISLTGRACSLKCDHCVGKILEGMIPVHDVEDLMKKIRVLEDQGNVGVLLSGGSDLMGRLPWDRFIEAIARIKKESKLRISIHTGLIDTQTALALEEAGVDEALVDVIGSSDTMQNVCHLNQGLTAIEDTLNALAATNLRLIPHILLGLHYGKIRGEWVALETVSRYPLSSLVVVVIRPLRGTPMARIKPPPKEEIGRFLAVARLVIPQTPMSLGCARPFGVYRREIDALAVEAGINRVAIPSEVAIKKAREMKLSIEFHSTCCSF